MQRCSEIVKLIPCVVADETLDARSVLRVRDVWTILPVNARTGRPKTFPELQNSLLSDSVVSSLIEVRQRG